MLAPLARLQAVRTLPLSRSGSSPVAGSCQMSVNKLIGGLIGLMLGVAVVTFLACGGIEVRAEVAQQLAKDSASIGCP